MKKCSTCGSEFPATPEFFFVRSDGYLEYQCKKCAQKRKQGYDHKKVDRVRRRKQQLAAWFKEWKKSKQCVKCGNTDWRTFDLHHRDPAEKDINPSHMVKMGWSVEKALIELAKCDVLCANCHRIYHYEE